MGASTRLSRRELLRNIGLAGAAAWIAPVLTALPASASTNPHQLCRGIPFGDCTNSFSQCGTCSSDVGDGSFCFAFLDSKGKLGHGTVCAEDSFCDELQPCLRHTDCPRGYACLTTNGCTNCDAKSGVCVKKCSHGLTPGGSKNRRRARPSSGRASNLRTTLLPPTRN